MVDEPSMEEEPSTAGGDETPCSRAAAAPLCEQHTFAVHRARSPDWERASSRPVGTAPAPSLHELLASLSLQRFGDALRSELGVEETADLQYCEDADLQSVGMLVVPRRKLLAHAKALMAQSAATATQATPAEAGETPTRQPSGAAPAQAELNERLITAIRRSKDAGAIAAVLDAGAELEHTDPEYGQTPLSWAAEVGLERVVALLLARKANPAATDQHGYTPLHNVIRKGLVGSASALLDAGADIDATNDFGTTPLHHAVKYNCAGAVKLLLERGACVMAKLVQDGETALHFAAVYNRADSCTLLLAAGADANVTRRTGSTPLHDCASADSEEMLAVLLEHDADARIKNNAAALPLHIAAQEGHAGCVRLLLEAAPDVINEPQGADEKRFTALHAAAVGCHEGVVALLLGAGAELNAVDSQGNTALMLAAREGHTSVVTLLVDAGADKAIKSRVGKTALDLASGASTKAALQRPARGASLALPDDVTAWLAAKSFSGHAESILRLGVTCLADLSHFRDQDLNDWGMNIIERRRFILEASKCAAPPKPVLRYSDSAASSAASCHDASPTACDVMISYRVDDAGERGDGSVFSIAAGLRALGYSVFVGEAAIQAGNTWPRTIQAGVEGCAAFVALCSPTYGDERVSPWTFREIVLASQLKKPIIPVWHSGAWPPAAVAIYLGPMQRVPGGAEDMHSVAIGVIVRELAGALHRARVPPSSPPQQAGGVKNAQPAAA